MFGMHKTRRFFINYKPIVNFCTMSFWVSIYIYFFFIIFVYIFIFCLPNKLYILLLLYINILDCKNISKNVTTYLLIVYLTYN